jgi:hypothetical protein
MVVDQDVFPSSIEPKIHCVWIEAGRRRHASFREGELDAVHGDGTPKDYGPEQ